MRQKKRTANSTSLPLLPDDGSRKRLKYLCAVYFEPRVVEEMSPSEGAEVTRASVQYNEELRKKGNFIAASALQWPKTAKTVRSRGGKIAMTDGPFAETKEVLGGFIFVEARDMDEAVRIAAGGSRGRHWRASGGTAKRYWEGYML